MKSSPPLHTKKYDLLRVIALAGFALVTNDPARAEFGLVSSDSGRLFRLDTDTDELERITFDSPSDCVITANGQTGFVGTSESFPQPHVLPIIGLDTAEPERGEDVSLTHTSQDIDLTADERFLLAVGIPSEGEDLLSVVNLSNTAVVGGYAPEGLSVLSVDACDNGSDVVASGFVDSDFSSRVLRLGISTTGDLSEKASAVVVGSADAYCVPGSQSVLSLDASFGRVESFSLPDLTPVSSVSFDTGSPLSATLRRDGTAFYTVGETVIKAFALDPATGAIGEELWSTDLGSPNHNGGGNDTLTLNTDETELYVLGATAIFILDPADGSLNRSIEQEGYRDGSGICFAQPPRLNPPALPSLEFSRVSETVTESAGTRQIALRLSAASAAAVTVTIGYSDSALRGSDFMSPTSVTIPAGQTTFKFALKVTNDKLDEPTETVRMTLGAPTGAVLGSKSQRTLTITDNDPTPTVQFRDASVSVQENQGTQNVVLQLSAASGRTVTIPISYSGTAKRNKDYSGPDSITIAAGQTAVSLPIQIINDLLLEGQETIVLSLGTPTNAGKGSRAQHTIRIAAGV